MAKAKLLTSIFRNARKVNIPKGSWGGKFKNDLKWIGKNWKWFTPTIAIPSWVASKAVDWWAGSDNPLSNRDATMIELGDAIVSQMNTGKHSWDPRSAAEHGIRYSTDPKYREDVRKYINHRIKANAGWVWDENGNAAKSPNGHFEGQLMQENNLKGFQAPGIEKSHMKDAWKAAGKPEGVLDLDGTAVANDVRSGIEQEARGAFADAAKANRWDDPFGAAIHASANGEIPKVWGDIAKWAKENPYLFWGGLAVGGIGLTALISSFLSANGKGGGGVTINNNSGQPFEPSFSPSFWRS